MGCGVVSKVAKAKLYGKKLNSMKKLFTFLLSTFAFLYGVLTDSELYFKIIISDQEQKLGRNVKIKSEICNLRI
ncbi:hypothetical protein FK004_15030 [Flavobacterium kingsejongi]|uniref:Uncharacterized protein n=1 Tax=Flavobacterium kingsejongi TaxID=1678728 RepID=A0A2S1LRU0_9FLAO|nr:hypothetical protein FK004_15030 [Flavobacterium kingsejongi]